MCVRLWVGACVRMWCAHARACVCVRVPASSMFCLAPNQAIVITHPIVAGTGAAWLGGRRVNNALVRPLPRRHSLQSATSSQIAPRPRKETWPPPARAAALGTRCGPSCHVGLCHMPCPAQLACHGVAGTCALLRARMWRCCACMCMLGAGGGEGARDPDGRRRTTSSCPALSTHPRLSDRTVLDYAPYLAMDLDTPELREALAIALRDWAFKAENHLLDLAGRDPEKAQRQASGVPRGAVLSRLGGTWVCRPSRHVQQVAPSYATA